MDYTFKLCRCTFIYILWDKIVGNYKRIDKLISSMLIAVSVNLESYLKESIA